MSREEPWYRRFGDLIAPAYAPGGAGGEPAGADAEVAYIDRDVIQAIAGTGRARRILDVGCGTGRHARRLAARGHDVTGVDCSPGLLDVARSLAASEPAPPAPGAGTLRWVEADARALSFAAEFDLVLSLHGGAFGLGLDEGDDEAVVRGMARALVPGGLLVLTATSAAGLVARYVEQAVMTAAEDATPPFDVATFVTRTTRVTGPDGAVHALPACWRAYTPRELSLLCRLCGLRVEGIFGCAPEEWQRRPLRLDDPEMLLIARKVADDPPVAPC